MVVIVTVDVHTGEIVAGPEIITRGWVHAPEAEDLLEEAPGRGAARPGRGGAARARSTSRPCSATPAGPLGKFVNERTSRRPMIVPVVMEV